MRQPDRHLFRVLGCPILVVVAALGARADERLGISEIRLAAAEEPVDAAADNQSTLAVTADEQALPAAESGEPATAHTADASPAKKLTAKPPFRRAMTPGTMARAQADPQVANNQIRHALNFYGGNPARATLSQFPRRSPIQTAPPQPIQKQIKPFNTVYHEVYHEPTISPYMNLYRDEKDTQSELNYFTLVRPQLDQIEANRAQQGEIQQLSRQLQSRSRPPAPPQYQSSGDPDRSTPARYMDTAQFYGGWNR